MLAGVLADVLADVLVQRGPFNLPSPIFYNSAFCFYTSSTFTIFPFCARIAMAALAPLEILDQIFNELSPVDLRNARLVCKSFALSAARHLFREIFLCPIKECVQNFDRITSHSTFREHVRSMIYSERVLPWFDDFDQWESRRDTSSTALKNLENLKDYYQAYVLRMNYEQDVQATEFLKRVLTRALAVMPNLVDVNVNPILQTRDMKKATILRVSRETLCEPYNFPGPYFGTYMRRCEMLESLCDSNSQIKVLEGRLLTRETLDRPSVPLHRLGRQIRHLALKVFGYEDRPTVGLLGLRQILEKALELETLQLSFYTGEASRPIIPFDQIWPNVVHYSSLKNLDLSVLRMSQLRLLEFLSLHASTLRSLHFYDIYFEWMEARDHICAGSWTDTIHFLEEHLNLTSVEFEGVLANGWNEAWFFEYEDHIDDYDYKPLTETLKYRIEQYIVEGGICPLDLPRGREKENKMDYWLEIGDWTCRWHPEGCKTSTP